MLQELQYLLEDQTPQIFTAIVLEVEEGEADQLLVKFQALPEGYEFVAPVAWSPGAFEKPIVGDIAVVLLIAKSMDNPVAISFMPRTGTGWLIPQRAIAGEMVFKSRAGQKLNISSDTRINIGKGGETEEAQPLVLGTVLKTFMTTTLQQVETLAGEVKNLASEVKNIFDKMSTGPICVPGTGTAATATGMASPGLAPLLPTAVSAAQAAADAADGVKSDLADARDTYLDQADSNILSQIAFTERGEPE